MRNFKILTSAICLISVFVLVGLVGEAHGFAWYGFSELCFDGNLKGPSGDTECTVTLEDVTVRVACDNENSNENSGECNPGEAHTGDLVQTITPIGGGTKDKNLLNVKGCFDFGDYDNHSSVAHVQYPEEYHSCEPASSNMVEVLGSAYVESFVATWTCISTKTGNVIETGRDTCTYEGTVDPDTCIPEHEAIFRCDEETFGKKYTFE